MKAKFRISSLLIILIILVTSCSQDDDGIFLNERNETIISYTELEFEILELVNDHRESIGIRKLNTLNMISSEAIPHTNYMLSQGEASHDNFEDRFDTCNSNRFISLLILFLSICIQRNIFSIDIIDKPMTIANDHIINSLVISVLKI